MFDPQTSRTPRSEEGRSGGGWDTPSSRRPGPAIGRIVVPIPAMFCLLAALAVCTLLFWVAS